LGIYLSKEAATAVLLKGKAGQVTVRDCISVTTAPEGDAEPQETTKSLATALAQQLSSKNLKFSDLSTAIDCKLFIQHDLHSQFTDHKQISQTIRFDAEEAVATDATELAITFSITGTDKNGSNMSVFTTRRDMLTDMLTDLQHNNLDPVTMEPDIVCLARLLQQNFDIPSETNPLFVILSAKACYIINIDPERSNFAPAVRSFLVHPTQDKTAVLSREIPVTLALHSSRTPERPITSLYITGETEGLDIETLGERTGLAIHNIELADICKVDAGVLEKASSECEFAIAYGLALGEMTKAKKYDFRQDFNPYQGKKIVLQKTLRFISISVTITMLAAAVFLQLKIFRKNNYIDRLNEKIKKDYVSVMFGKNPPPAEPIASKLKREYNRILKIKSGQIAGDDESVTAKLTFIFEAISSAPTKIDLKIHTISITAKTMRIIGDTKGRSSTLSLFKAIKKHPKLKVSQQNLKQSGNRDTFTITLDPK
jgi:hypothetical protein